jgi:hypothetical protein
MRSVSRFPLPAVVLLAAALLAAPAMRALNPAENPGNYSVRHWDTEDGLPHNSIKHLVQTHDGYLWIGTGYGLARFDGLTFTVFNKNNTPEMRSSVISSLTETSDGNLWIGTGSGLLRYRNGRFTRYDRANGMRSETISALCESPDRRPRGRHVDGLWHGTAAPSRRQIDGVWLCRRAAESRHPECHHGSRRSHRGGDPERAVPLEGRPVRADRRICKLFESADRVCEP